MMPALIDHKLGGKCPWCDAPFYAASGINSDHAPRPGSLGVCSNCASVIEFGSDGKSHRCPDAVWQSLPGRTPEIIRQARRAILQSHAR